MSTYNYTPGLGNAASYQVSGKPFVTGAISPVNGTVRIDFPAVTRWVMVRNTGAASAFVGFSEAGVDNAIGADNFFWEIDPRPGPAAEGRPLGPVDLKLTQLFVSGSRVDSQSIFVMAGLTGIPNGNLNTVSGSIVQLGGAGIQGPNWSGSAGVG
tara:strand:+ start:943 stop:1407 length:465 start_codon:yes stop_codon:yes gene_type:complete